MADYGYLHNNDTANGESRMFTRQQAVGDHVCRPVIEEKRFYYRGTPINLSDYGGKGTNDTTTEGWPRGGIHEMDINGWSKQSGGIHEASTNWWSRPNGRTNDMETSAWGKPRGATNAIGTNEWSRPSDNPYDTNTNGWGASISITDIIGNGGWGRPNSRTNNMASNRWSRPTETTIHQPFYDGSFEKNESSMDGYHETTTDGRGTPTHAGWAKPSTYKRNITRPTSDIGAAVDYLKESVKPSSVTTMTPWQGQISALSSSYPIEETPIETIDSKEAKRRYGNLPVTPLTINPTAATIDSREAARKYKGSFV